MTVRELHDQLNDLLQTGYGERDVLAGGRWPIDQVSVPTQGSSAPVYLDLGPDTGRLTKENT